MAAEGGGTPGGVVSIQEIINQIASIQEGMNTIVDSVINSTNSIVLAAKVKIAKRKIKSVAHSLTELITSVNQTIEEMLNELDTQTIDKNFSELVNNPALFAISAMNPNSQKDVALLGDKKAGVLELILGLVAAVNLIANLDIPGSLKMRRQMKKLNKALTTLSNGLQSMSEHLKKISDSISKNPIDDALLGVVNATLEGIKSLFGDITQLALLSTLLVPIVPIAIMGTMLIVNAIRGMIFVLMLIGSPKSIARTAHVLFGVKQVLRKLLKCIWLFANTIASIVGIILIVSTIGTLLPALFVPFLIGITTLAIYFGILYLAMKGLTKLSRRLSVMSTGLLINMLITAAVITVLALTFLLLATVADTVVGSIMNVIILLGVMGGILLAVMGFMVLVAMIAPAVAIGIVAMALVILSILVLMTLVGALLLLTWIAQWLDEKATQEAVSKVMSVAEYTIQAVLNTNFTKQKDEKQDSDVRQLVGELIGDEFLTIFDLAVKSVILMMTVIAVVIMFALVAVLVGFVKYYNEGENKKAIDGAPEIIENILAGAAKIIQLVLNSNTGAKANQKGLMDNSDGIFLELVGFVLGEDVVSIFKLLFKVVIIMLTIVVLLMVRVLMSELKWIYEAYGSDGATFFGPDGTASTMISTIMKGCNEIITSVLNSPATEPTAGGNGIFIALIDVVSPELATIIQLLFKVVIIAMTMVVLAMLKVVMDELKWLWDIYTNDFGGKTMLVNVETMVSNILGTVDKIIMLLASKPKNEPNDSPRKGLDKLLSFLHLDQLANIVNLLCSFARIGLAILALSVLGSVASLMKDVWDTYQAMGGDSIGANATKMVIGIGDGINAMIAAMMNIKVNFGEAKEADEGKGQWKVWNVAYNKIIHLIDNIFGSGVSGLIDLMDAAGNIRASIPIITSLGAVAEYLNASMKAIDQRMEGIRRISSETVPEMIRLTTEMVSAINGMNIGDLELCDNNLQKIDETCRKISNTFNNLLGGKAGSMSFVVKNAEKYRSVVIDTDKLVNKINGLNIAKMKVLAEMFGNAAAFSQSLNGNFDKLAEVLSEKLSPILEGLQHTIEDADKHIEEYTKRQEETAKGMSDTFSKLTTPTVNAVDKPAPTNSDNVGAQSQVQGKLAQVERTKSSDIQAAIKQALREVIVKVDTTGRS